MVNKIGEINKEKLFLKFCDFALFRGYANASFSYIQII
jgi:hypothetical protein